MGSVMWAKEDGIEIVNGRFMLTCSKCGKIFPYSSYSRKRAYKCSECRKAELREKRRLERESDTRSPSEKRFDSAVEKLRKQKIGSSWESAIKVAKTRMDRYGSIPEVMMAIALIHYKYSIIPQQKVGSLTADFVIPKTKTVVEVDGKLYHRNKYDMNYRDFRLRNSLGMEWEILHVPAEAIEKDVRNAIDFYVNKQKSTVIRWQ